VNFHRVRPADKTDVVEHSEVLGILSNSGTFTLIVAACRDVGAVWIGHEECERGSKKHRHTAFFEQGEAGDR
jgi:hypothetical protein